MILTKKLLLITFFISSITNLHSSNPTEFIINDKDPNQIYEFLKLIVRCSNLHPGDSIDISPDGFPMPIVELLRNLREEPFFYDYKKNVTINAAKNIDTGILRDGKFVIIKKSFQDLAGDAIQHIIKEIIAYVSAPISDTKPYIVKNITGNFASNLFTVINDFLLIKPIDIQLKDDPDDKTYNQIFEEYKQSLTLPAAQQFNLQKKYSCKLLNRLQQNVAANREKERRTPTASVPPQSPTSEKPRSSSPTRPEPKTASSNLKPLDGKNINNLYPLLNLNIRCSSLNPGDAVEISPDGKPLKVITLLRTLRENPFFSNYKKKIAEKQNVIVERGEQLRKIQTLPYEPTADEAINTLINNIIRYLSNRNNTENDYYIENVSNEFKESFKRLIIDFFNITPLNVNQVSDDEMTKLYVEYAQSLTKSQRNQYDAQKGYSLGLLNAFQQANAAQKDKDRNEKQRADELAAKKSSPKLPIIPPSHRDSRPASPSPEDSSRPSSPVKPKTPTTPPLPKPKRTTEPDIEPSAVRIDQKQTLLNALELASLL